MFAADPYPPSFDNSPLLYAWALGSITALACLMAMVCGWMARELWADRRYVHPKTALTAFRVLLMCASGTSCIRALPEALYMYSWNEASEDQMRLILLFKRVADGLSIGPGAIWTFLLFLAYPAIAHALKSQAATGTDLWSSWPHLVRPVLAIAIIFLIAFLVAISKLYLGVPHQ